MNLHDLFEDFSVLKEEDMASDHLPFLLKLNINDNNSCNNNYLRFRKKRHTTKRTGIISKERCRFNNSNIY